MTTAARTKINPINDRIVIKADARETQSPGGITLVDSATERPQQGTVVAVGPGRPIMQETPDRVGAPRYPMQTKVGDIVVYSQYTDTITVDEEEFVLVREDDLYAILS